ncbi:hypothetical protein [Erythrobacter sanguineus]|jgi:hypothetical protein|uniref:Uncharacterized protein n=2 Tax=Erythrobacter sanguineus TaxID=198312 RepID=A0A1M7S591_9SPHN|nr:hypothetical protein [Erythrobacter sanguineus]SHN53797.1 hypothetical protein SAMN02745193_01030 [Erythrobacter sanguineus]
MFRMVLKAFGGLLIAFGTMWALQGLGLLNWPAGTFMLASSEWALYGALTAVGGAFVIWGASRLGRPRD